MHDHLREIEGFLYREARLLDQGRLHEWLDLFTDDARYMLPVHETIQGADAARDEADPDLAFGLFDDNKNSLEMRVRRLDTGLAHVEEPPSLTQRLITNVEVEDAPSDGSDGAAAREVLARSAFLLYQVRRDRSGTFFVGRREDLLRPQNGQWKIARRTVHLAQNVLPRTLSVFF